MSIKGIKKGMNVYINSYYFKKELVGQTGIVKEVFHDKDCIYAQHPWAEVQLNNGQKVVLITSFVNEVEE